MINIEDLTLKEIKSLAAQCEKVLGTPITTKTGAKVTVDCPLAPQAHPMLGKRCIIRTYSAGVHIGNVEYVNPDNSMEVLLKDSIRLWSWEGGGLSLSAIANNGMKGGRTNYTGEVYLTNAIEYIPVSAKADKTFKKYLEDVED